MYSHAYTTHIKNGGKERKYCGDATDLNFSTLGEFGSLNSTLQLHSWLSWRPTDVPFWSQFPQNNEAKKKKNLQKFLREKKRERKKQGKKESTFVNQILKSAWTSEVPRSPCLPPSPCFSHQRTQPRLTPSPRLFTHAPAAPPQQRNWWIKCPKGHLIISLSLARFVTLGEVLCFPGVQWLYT